MEDDPAPTPAPGKPSQVPSWVALGFVLGALFILALPRRAGVEPAQGAAPAQPAPVRPPAPPMITTIEAVFAAWGKNAVWSDGTTEVALWDAGTKSYSDCYEVTKLGDACYFRSISALTRPILTHGVESDSPLEFTETARQREEWLGEVNRENWKAISDSERQSPQPVPASTDAQK